ncbi:nucleotidyltransferase substrate binding protein [Bacteroides oleiciplenus]|uniref:HI0074 family nucleotidyltransferase substrate binding protein n=1 Tax=Bacteroides oleiciplenus YIT 12058 TaxID=742727 RepID=K9E9G3_9BACE|nr:nucleotidyltransferase substrate binding protein [Bacteroides oleiciplenus]EKU92461.1 HI0074 family nucleotidyltransferase substrate binding protein [Bacteroides oleiciplenus YIT 12058]
MEILGTDNQDIRWKQRFQNYEKAFNRLSRAIEIVRITPDDDLLQSGLVQTYEYTFELAWKTLKDYLEMEGFLLRSPRETIRQGFQSGYITNAEDWLQALADRNLAVHIYDDEIIARVLKDIYERYFFILQEFYNNFKTRINE